MESRGKMQVLKNSFYVIDDQFFEDFPDPCLKGNKEENRPHYYCLEDGQSGLFWIIPLSSRAPKYQQIINNRNEQKKPCDILHIHTFAGRTQVFLIQDMFPITQEYLIREYTIGDVPLKLLDTSVISVIEKKAKKVLNMIRRGIRLNPTQPDVLAIEATLLERLRAEAEAAAARTE